MSHAVLCCTAGCADDLISDILGGADPLAFGFTSQGSDPDSLSNKPSTLELSAAAGGVVVTGRAGSGTLQGSSPRAAGAAGTGTGTGGQGTHGSSGAVPAPQQPRAAAQAAAPTALHKFRESRLWSVLSHGANFDIHEVGGSICWMAICRTL